jgi:UDP-N-acetylmuramate--alanine ligase
VEADEYAGNFDPYRPELAVLTSAEWDHPDVFADRVAVIDTFAAWLSRAPTGATLVANVGDEGVAAVVERLAEWPGSVVAYALVDQAPQRLGGYARGISERYSVGGRPAATLFGRVTASDPAGTTLDIHGLDPLAGPVSVRLALAGRHNAANALAVTAAAAALGVPPAAITGGLASFEGVGRRLERKGEAAGVTVYDDYGHHPTAIRETLAAVRQREPGRRVWVAFEPLTFHRTAAMLDAFADVLATADAVAIADIWAGRDPDTTIASADRVAAAVAARRPELPVFAPGPVEATADRLANEVRRGDVVLVMGGGQSYQIGERLLERLGGTT